MYKEQNWTNTDDKRPIAKGFWESYCLYPDRNAIFINNQYYTYKQVAEKVCAIYSAIKNAETDSKERIAIITNNNIETYAGIIAISLYGAAYVPINTKNPANRIKSILKEANVSLVLCYKQINELLNEPYLFLLISNLSSTVIGEPKQVLNTGQAYAMFTSGSSGTPKGVKVSNANVNQYLGVMLKSDIYDFKKEDKFLQAFELTFDASVQWIFAPLSIGACIYVPEENKSIAIADAMAKHCLTVAMMVPSTLYYLQPYFKELVFESIRYFFAGGEALSVQLLKAWKPCVPNAIVENLYGPTEATIWCTRYRVDLTVLSKTEFVSIGKPNPGIEVLILDENNEEVVDKKKGQLCVYGKQVVEGYIDSSENGAFVVINKKRYYGTGDLVYVDEQQNLNYCGRIDNQIKMNGYRIEPEEIEKEIFAYCGLVNVVVAKSLAEGHLQIVAYIENFKSDVSDLKTALRLKLPDYMIPSKIISIPKMPLNANGKMDRNAILNIKA